MLEQENLSVFLKTERLLPLAVLTIEQSIVAEVVSEFMSKLAMDGDNLALTSTVRQKKIALAAKSASLPMEPESQSVPFEMMLAEPR